MERVTRRKTVLGALGAGAVALAGCVSGDDDPSGDDVDTNGDGDGAGTGDESDAENGDDTGDSDDSGGKDGADIELEVTLEHVASGCAESDDDHAALFYDEEAAVYTIEGVLPSPNPCHTPVLVESGYEDGTVSLTIDVEEDLPDDESCATCAGEVVYECTVAGVDPDDVDQFEIVHETREIHTLGEATPAGSRPSLGSVELISSDSRSRTGEDEDADWVRLADIDDEAGILTIDGLIPTSTPHYQAVLVESGLVRGELRLAVDVESTLGDDELGTTELGVVEYEVVAEIDNVEALDRASVKHPDSTHSLGWDSASESEVEEGDDSSDGSGY